MERERESGCEGWSNLYIVQECKLKGLENYGVTQIVGC